MRFGYTILYVEDVARAIDFYERAFGLSRRFITDDVTYGEIETDDTPPSFAKHMTSRTVRWTPMIRPSHLPNTRWPANSPPPDAGVMTHAKHTLASQFIPGGYRRNDPAEQPAGVEIGFVADDVPAAWDAALAAGAMKVSPPETKP